MVEFFNDKKWSENAVKRLEDIYYKTLVCRNFRVQKC